MVLKSSILSWEDDLVVRPLILGTLSKVDEKP